MTTTITATVKLLARKHPPSGGLRMFGSTQTAGFPMKAGTELKNLAVFKGQDTPVTLERSEYPDWVGELATPQPSLAALRKIPNEEADLTQIKRFLKLGRRQAVRQRNEESTA
mmetsp:Transcript_26188/g.57354  ORF Transcript_26188/g.57354 Transcript_26188/m.57354 type:complete len:113 (-) Transcript_26188:223-561(-)|eukprot:CAMPEP_0168272188 /NCGR_PEP_ID=MMETSP0141_2-20121125/16029_1 /TAXON_ID=44445 /ORGANISM="Pseudo-nitzschia australis, Strain 10249 10 AB" /LENGTH=112 /DNA_ID=CAMNT_0008213487 /DNA_START=222 /DNA_END=560 /DNA_ORIENTATION=+